MDRRTELQKEITKKVTKILQEEGLEISDSSYGIDAKSKDFFFRVGLVFTY